MNEHKVYNKDGSLAGLHRIDVDKCKKLYGYWDGIDALVQAYTMVHPHEMRQAVVENQAVRENNYDAFGAGKQKGLRHGLSLPPGLYHLLNEFDQSLFKDKKKLQKFMRDYKGLRTCKEV
tara:strand:- start:46 stop:405 length:360 start_codon:yes stop_codon:yes gene_type:complete